MDVQEVRKLDAYLKRLFNNPRMRVVPRPKKDDSAEVYIGEEFIGVIFVDDEDDERSYNFQMAILAPTSNRSLPSRSRARRAQLAISARYCPATGRQSLSQSRRKRTVTSASTMRRT